MLGALFSPVTKYVILLIAVFGFVAWQRHDAASSARAKAEIECRDETARRTNQELERQLTASKTVLRRANAKKIVAEDALKQLKEKADVLLSEAGVSREQCLLDPGVRRRLLDIR